MPSGCFIKSMNEKRVNFYTELHAQCYTTILIEALELVPFTYIDTNSDRFVARPDIFRVENPLERN